MKSLNRVRKELSRKLSAHKVVFLVLVTCGLTPFHDSDMRPTLFEKLWKFKINLQKS